MAGSIQRRVDWDMARAIAALCVILHHVLQYFPRLGMPFPNAAALRELSLALPYVHMPVFSLLAGAVVAARGRKVRTLGDYAQFERKKFLRLMLPYFSLSILQGTIKLFATARGLDEIKNEVLAVFVVPHGGAMPHGWFLYMLMLIFLFWPLIRPVAESRAVPLLLAVLIGVAVWPIAWPLYHRTLVGQPDSTPYFELHRLSWYLPMFIIGYMYGRHRYSQGRPRGLAVVLAGVLFALGLLSRLQAILPESEDVAFRATKWLASLSGGFFVILFCGWWGSRPGRTQSILAKTGYYSYDIYLFHVIVGHAMVLALRKLGAGGTVTYVLVPTVVVASALISWGIGKALRRVPPLAFLVLGVPRRPMPRAGQARPSGARRTEE